MGQRKGNDFAGGFQLNLHVFWRFIGDNGSAEEYLAGPVHSSDDVRTYIERNFDEGNFSIEERNFLYSEHEGSFSSFETFLHRIPGQEEEAECIWIDFPCYIEHVNEGGSTVIEPEFLEEDQHVESEYDLEVNDSEASAISIDFGESGESGAKTKQHRYMIPTFCTVNNQSWACHIVSDEEPAENESVGGDNGVPDTEVVFLIDGTQSMAEEVNAIKRTCASIADAIIEAGTSVKLGLVTYGIATQKFQWKKNMPSGVILNMRKPPKNLAFWPKGSEQYCTVGWPMMEPQKFSRVINEELKLRMAGGRGCYFAGSGTHDVILDTLGIFSDGYKKKDWSDISRFIIHISDEYDYSQRNENLQQIISTCNTFGITVHTWGKNIPGHTEISTQTGGDFWNINRNLSQSEFDSIMNSISVKIAEAVSLRIPNTLEYISGSDRSGPTCSQWHSSPMALESQQGSIPSRSTVKLLDGNKGYVAISEFKCLYCDNGKYMVCNCGMHSCRGGEIPSMSSNHSSEATCNGCGIVVPIREETEVHSTAGSTKTGKGK